LVAVPPLVVTAILTVPGATLDGDETTIEIAEVETIVPGEVPNITLDAPSRFVPEIVTLVPPTVEPEPGVVAEMVGGTIA